MKKKDITLIVLEGVASIVVGILADSITRKFKKQGKKEDFDNTLVADLTVAELKKIIKDEA